MLHIPKRMKVIRKKNPVNIEKLLEFENKIKNIYEDKIIRGPVHLSGGNEKELTKIFKYISEKDWVCSNWRNHYHALLHGVPKFEILKQIIAGKSMSMNYKSPNFIASSIVGGTLPIALGLSLSLKKNKSKRKVWCFVGDMTAETGVFHEVYKYSRNFDLPLELVIEDNNKSTDTPTNIAWGRQKVFKFPKDVIYYNYKLNQPHHGTGKWIMF